MIIIIIIPFCENNFIQQIIKIPELYTLYFYFIFST